MQPRWIDSGIGIAFNIGVPIPTRRVPHARTSHIRIRRQKPSTHRVVISIDRIIQPRVLIPRVSQVVECVPHPVVDLTSRVPNGILLGRIPHSYAGGPAEMGLKTLRSHSGSSQKSRRNSLRVRPEGQKDRGRFPLPAGPVTAGRQAQRLPRPYFQPLATSRSGEPGRPYLSTISERGANSKCSSNGCTARKSCSASGP